MKKIRYNYWQDGTMWLGYLVDYPDYWSQGKTFLELQENLRDLSQDVTGGTIPCIRKVAELEIV